MDAVARIVPGVLGDETATSDDSFSEDGLLEYPQYTKPPVFRGWEVPEILIGGNHVLQAKWKRQQSLIRTLEWRPDLLEKAPLTKEDKRFLETYLNEKKRVEFQNTDD